MKKILFLWSLVLLCANLSFAQGSYDESVGLRLFNEGHYAQALPTLQ